MFVVWLKRLFKIKLYKLILNISILCYILFLCLIRILLIWYLHRYFSLCRFYFLWLLLPLLLLSVAIFKFKFFLILVISSLGFINLFFRGIGESDFIFFWPALPIVLIFELSVFIAEWELSEIEYWEARSVCVLGVDCLDRVLIFVFWFWAFVYP